MSKQEEIRVGLAAKLASFEGRDYWRMTDADKEYWLTQAYGSLEYLDGEGVVIQVKSELPIEPTWGSLDGQVIHGVKSVYAIALQDMLEWHNNSLEPLIEKKT